MRLQEIGGALARWALGLGLLRAHLAVFTVGAVALVIADLYRTPAEFGAGGSLRLWAIVLACHAAALFAGWATWRAVRPHRIPNPGRPIPPPPVAHRPVSPPAPHGAGWPANGRASIPAPGSVAATADGFAPRPAPPLPAASPNGAVPPTAPLPARGRFNPPPSAPAVVGQGSLPHLHAGEASAKLRAGAAGAVAAGRSGWQRLAEATRSGATAIKERLTRSGAKHDAAGNGTISQPATPPAGWPAPPVVSEVPAGWEQVASPAGPPGESTAVPPAVVAQGWPAPAAGQHGSPPASAPAAPHGEPPLKAETEWTWMEAAAASWLARRDAEVGDAGPSGSPPTGPAGGAEPLPGDAGDSPARP